MKIKNILDNKKFNTAMNVISTVILVISITICVNVMLSANSNIGVPSFAGYSFLSVRSNSMSPTFEKYDLIIVKRYDPIMGHEYQVGDVISFATAKKDDDSYADGEKYINTHRIVEVINGANGKAYVTQGDHPDAPIDEKHVPSANVLGKYTEIRIPKLGKVLAFSKTPGGVILMIILPAALIVIWQLFSYLRSLANKRVPTVAAPTTAAYVPQQYYPPAAENEKEAIIKEYLQKQQAEEARKQQIIEEYLAKQKEIEEAEKAKAEEEKIKAIIAEFLAQQKAAEEAAQSENIEEKTVKNKGQ